MQWFIDTVVAICKAYTDQAILDAKVIPVGTIIMWTGLYGDCPDGWEVCDGQHLTPDLRSYFVRSSGSGVIHGAYGGSSTHSHEPGTGLASGKDRSHTASNIPPYYALWFIMKMKL